MKARVELRERGEKRTVQKSDGCMTHYWRSELEEGRVVEKEIGWAREAQDFRWTCLHDFGIVSSSGCRDGVGSACSARSQLASE